MVQILWIETTKDIKSWAINVSSLFQDILKATQITVKDKNRIKVYWLATVFKTY